MAARPPHAPSASAHQRIVDAFMVALGDVRAAASSMADPFRPRPAHRSSTARALAFRRGWRALQTQCRRAASGFREVSRKGPIPLGGAVLSEAGRLLSKVLGEAICPAAGACAASFPTAGGDRRL